MEFSQYQQLQQQLQQQQEQEQEQQQFYNVKELRQLAPEDLMRHCISLQVCAKRRQKNLQKQTNKVEKLLERLAKKEAKKKPEIEIFPAPVPSLVTKISELSWKIRQKFPFGGKEHHFQAALEIELRDQNYTISSEVAGLLHYTQENGQTRQLPHDIRGREDLVLPRQRLILELKQTRGLGNSEHMQLMRYMKERRTHSDWGLNTQGMLINFGDDDVEIWWMFYGEFLDPPEITRVCIFKKKITPIEDKYPLFKLS